MSGKYIEQKFATSSNEVFNDVAVKDALLYTNADNFHIGKMNSDKHITLNNQGTTVKGTLDVQGTHIFRSGYVITDGIVVDAESNLINKTITIDDNSVTSNMLADNSVESRHIQAGAVGSDELANGAVTTDKILAYNISAVHLSIDAVQTSKILNGAVTTDKIADHSVTTDKIMAYNVEAVHLANNSVQTSKILNGAVSTDKIANGNVTTDKIADSSVTSNKVSSTTGTGGTFVLADNPIISGTVRIDGAISSRMIIDKDSDSAVSSVIFTVGGASISNGWAEIGLTQDKDLHFRSNDVAGTYTDRMVIKHTTGNVGIGTTDPIAKLHVNGSLNVSGTANMLNPLTIGQNSGFNVEHTNPNCLLRVRPVDSNTANNGGVEIGSITGNSPYIGANQGVGPDGSTINSYSLHFRTSNQARMTIKADGNVGIGTTNTQSKLHVNGDVRADAYRVTSDDRIKSDETFVTDAMGTLNKLRPQNYKKWSSRDYMNTSSNATYELETGLIAQEMFYDAPELRHLVTLPYDADATALYDAASNISSSLDPLVDPEYKNWGESGIACVDYIGLIPILVKALQEKDLEIQEIKTRLQNHSI